MPGGMMPLWGYSLPRIGIGQVIIAESRRFQIMAFNPLKILSLRFQVKSMILFALLLVYIGISLFLFFGWVAPSLDGRTDQHIAADSQTYLYFADSLRNRDGNPWVIASLATFPNTLWCPVLLALVFRNTFVMVLVNYALFLLALVLLKKTFSFSTGAFLGLMLLNPTTTISLLSVNKEIIDFLAISIFFFAYRKHRKGLLLAALLLALFNRYEVCMVMMLFLMVSSFLNPLRRRRGLTLIVLVTSMSVLLPLLVSESLSSRFEEASTGQTIVQLDSLEMHYLYGVAVIPKLAEMFFGELLNFSKRITSYADFSDIANTYIMFFNNLATAFVLFVLARKRALMARSDLIYFAMLGCIIGAVSLVIQPRYVYFVYVVLCLQAAHPRARRPLVAFSPAPHKEIANA
jgi:hypothetical protein